jgi:hypothetical protein
MAWPPSRAACNRMKAPPRGLGSLRNGLVLCSSIEAFAKQTRCQFDQRWTVVLASVLIPSEAEYLRTTRTQTAPTTRRKGTRSFPGLQAVNNTCPSILAGVSIRYMRGRNACRPQRRVAAEAAGKQAKQSWTNHQRVAPRQGTCFAAATRSTSWTSSRLLILRQVVAPPPMWRCGGC